MNVNQELNNRSLRPYLIRAIYAWITDGMFTPHILVNTNVEGVQIPPGVAKDGKVVLNVSMSATDRLTMNDDGISFSARFNGASRNVFVPNQAIIAIYAKETGQGMALPPDSPSHPEPAAKPVQATPIEAVEDRLPMPGSDTPPATEPAPPRRKGHLSVVK